MQQSTSIATTSSLLRHGCASEARLAPRRLLDVLGAAAGLLLSLPILLAAIIAVRLSLGAPVFFRQVRPGRNERLFALFKLRTMTNATDARGRPLPEVIRITPLGILLRRLSIDELPPLWNVLRGEMALVGPRPLFTRYLPCYSPREHTRHLVLPGITGLAQISGRNLMAWDDRLELDARYVERRSLAFDLWILRQTVRKVLGSSGVVIIPEALMDDLCTEREKRRARALASQQRTLDFGCGGLP
jgi:lipopolysaccharide/colanic/teichoic acid biosynthesis glycosyltransferase